MSSTQETFSIGTFAKAAGVNVETIRFYQCKRLLAEPDRPPGGIRRYGKAEVARVKFVQSSQRLGFTLEEVAQLLRLEDGTRCKEAASLAALRLVDVRSRLADLKRMEMVLVALVEQCDMRQCGVSCPLITSLHAC